MNTPRWLTKISKIFWPWALTLKKLSSSWILGIWASCTPMSVDSRSTSTLPLSRPSLGFNLLTTVERLHTLLFRQPHASQAASLTSLATRTSLASFPAVSTRTLTSGWQGTFAQSWKLPSQQASTTSFSLPFKDSMSRCQDRFLNQESSWLTSPKRSKQRSKSMHSVEEKLQKKNSRNMEPTWLLT